MARFHNVNGEQVPFTAEEEAQRDAEEAAHLAGIPDVKAAEISAEAERRIVAGVDIPGVGLFKARTEDITRLQGMLTTATLLEATSQPVAITFRTSAGATVTVTSSAEIKSLFLAVSGHVASVMGKSAALQNSLAGMTAAAIAAFDATDPAHWV